MPRTNFRSPTQGGSTQDLALICRVVSEEKVFEKYERTDNGRRTMGIHCSKDLKERRTIFPCIAVLNTPMFNLHLKAIQNDLECPPLLHHLNYASKSLTTRNLIQEMSCQRPKAILVKNKFCQKLEIFRNKPKHGRCTLV